MRTGISATDSTDGSGGNGGSGARFVLRAPGLTYALHVEDGEVVLDHFGGPAPRAQQVHFAGHHEGWGSPLYHARREFPDLGRGDFRTPAVVIRHVGGHTVSALKYTGYEIVKGKPGLEGLPATFGEEDEVQTLLITLEDGISGVKAELSYSVFLKLDAIARSVRITNGGSESITLGKVASLSVDLPSQDMELLHTHGNWGQECTPVRRKVDFGTQGFKSTCGFSSPFHNPFFALVHPTTDEVNGPAWGFSFVYSGSFAAEVERSTYGGVRAQLGLNPLQLSWPLAPGETFQAPEVVAVFSRTGLGGMSRTFHRLFRVHLLRSRFALQPRPPLINHWEATYFTYDEETLLRIARTAADIGVRRFVMDDGWFGRKHPRVADNAGLGDWVANVDRFPGGLGPFVKRITALPVRGSAEPMSFGIWVEPEMVNPASELYEAHPDWVLHAATYRRTEIRNQLILNLGLPEVQDYIIDAISAVLTSADISYVKWDNNRGMLETPAPSAAHRYLIGLYRVVGTLTAKFPHILFEGCASGGGRYDPGLLQFFPQTWVSDNTDGLDRLTIQAGTTLVYPASTMGCHISNVPSHQSFHITPFAFRAHVALMGGGFGFEVDLSAIPEEDRRTIPHILELAERVNPLVIRGDMYRLAPASTNWPAVMYLAEDGAEGVVFAFQKYDGLAGGAKPPVLRFQGLDPAATYDLDGEEYEGAELLFAGITMAWKGGDYHSRIMWIKRVA